MKHLIEINKTQIMKYCKLFAVFNLALICSYTAAHTVNTTVNVNDFTKSPVLISDAATPKVMLTMSNDHQLYFKLYTDWDDLDDDGVQDTTYNHDVDYYGYFDSYKCYSYSTSDTRFEPEGVTSTKLCTGSLNNAFSGNFLNWASMTRIDAIRKVLYGGYRSTDEDELTVLERSFLPTDAHSFAKHYEPVGSDPEIRFLTPFNTNEITMCNTTFTTDSGSDGVSQNVDEPPLIRVVNGDFRYWAANERWQCTWNGTERTSGGSGTNFTDSAEDHPVLADDALGEANYVARVVVCDSSLLGTENCNTYDDSGTTRYKPIGLLQTYGESGSVDFGLITGSYEKNKSGGVVRKDIESFASEIDPSTGRFTGINGIISTIDKFRIANYAYSDSGRYNNADSCPWGISAFTEGNCSNWGNPFSEIYLEAVRYFAGLNKNAAFDVDDTSYIPGLTDVTTWTDPLTTDTRCASCNIVIINASDITYDNDSLSMSGLPGTPSAVSLTNAVGILEGISGSRFFVGESGSSNDQLCTPKSITNFGDVLGTCPNAPRLSGTYNIAGVAHWAHTEDIRTDLADIQKINTYAIALAPSTPSLEIPNPSNTDETLVTILPACRNTSTSDESNCAIVDFKILEQDITGGTGAIYVNWEDSEQGGDFDQDMAGVIFYRILGSNITIGTDVHGLSTGFELGFGYVIDGTTDDGFHVHSGINGFVYDEAGTTDDCASGCSDTGAGVARTTRTYTIGSSSASLLNDPLWYAAKYGGFTDLDDDSSPVESNSDEWDTRDTSGNSGADGIPDNYFPVFNPSELEDRMNQVFNAIINRVSAGNAAAVVSKTSSGIGAVYQAIYQPLIKDGVDEVEWSGFLHGIFIDGKGLLREDSDSDGILDGYGVDSIIEIFYNESEDETQVQRYTTSDGGATQVADGESQPLYDIKPIWSAVETMSLISNNTLKSNRTYDPSLTTNGRFMYTWIDDLSGSGTVGAVDDGELVPFIASSFGSPGINYRYLNVADPDDGVDDGNDAGDIVNFVRGVTGIPNQRNREIDYDDDGVTEKLRIGDIIHSTPVAVGEPHDGYDVVYSDSTYRDFRAQYYNRRQVIYVGGNDGVIHAFNAGFWDSSVNGFVTDLTDAVNLGLPLGAELWGYVPMNLLPHLKWLPEEDYPHVYYMDAEPLVFDAKIFTDDTTHPDGWGTVLVVGMRLGGGDITLDIDGDDTLGSSGDLTTRSAYVVLDITDPESPPTLIAEITDENLNFTMGRPEVISMRTPDASGDYNAGTNEWYLVFGSGPNDISTNESDQTQRVYMWDLESKSFVSGFDGSNFSPALPRGYSGDFTVVDWDLDGLDDTVYFGTDETQSGTAGGGLQRIEIDSTGIASSDVSTVINAGQPMVNKPLAVREGTNRWVFMGTGRLFTTTDVQTTSQETFYGVKDDAADPDNTYSLSDLQNVTGVDVFTEGYIDDVDGVLTGEPSGTDAAGFSWLESEIESQDGWYFNMNTSGSATRSLGNAVSVNKLLAYTLYTPTQDLCDNIGSTTLRINCLTTGTACPFNILGTETTVKGDRAIGEVDFTSGLVTDISIHFDGEGNPIVIGHGQHGNIQRESFSLPPLISGRLTWREITDY